jgi:hypothetical protein
MAGRYAPTPVDDGSDSSFASALSGLAGGFGSTYKRKKKKKDNSGSNPFADTLSATDRVQSESQGVGDYLGGNLY